MRLTLRTLLAYNDRTLDASDSVVLATKVNSSSFAKSIVERIEIADDRLTEAISVRRFGSVDDPNRVGEYLDSVLGSSDVENIERLCIESSQHLIEVGVIHHVLSLMLGKKTDVPNSLRHRSYSIDPSRSFDDAVHDAIFSVVLSNNYSNSPLGPIGSSSDSKVTPVRQRDSGVWDAHKRFNYSTLISDLNEANNKDYATADRIENIQFFDSAAIRAFSKIKLGGWLLALMLLAILFLFYLGAFN